MIVGLKKKMIEREEIESPHRAYLGNTFIHSDKSGLVKDKKMISKSYKDGYVGSTYYGLF